MSVRVLLSDRYGACVTGRVSQCSDERDDDFQETEVRRTPIAVIEYRRR
ncbi:hypothetical protein MNJPNG_14970 [Cupriavidus oxalaticus]